MPKKVITARFIYSIFSNIVLNTLFYFKDHEDQVRSYVIIAARRTR